MAHRAGFLRRGLLMTFCLAIASLGFCETRLVAQETSSDKPLAHRHTPITLHSRPIISKYDVSLTRPRRVLYHKGTLFVADFGAGTVVSISKNGRSRLIAEDLNEPAGLAVSKGQLYVSTFAQGMEKAGTIVRIPLRRDAMASVFATGLSGPTALAFDSQDNLYVAGLTLNTVSRVDSNGEVTTFIPNVNAPTGLLFDAKDNLYVLSASEGSLYRADTMAELTRVASGFNAPSDLVAGPAKQMIVVDYGRRRLVAVSPKGKLKPFALVPRGTVTATFDRLGNVIIANSDDMTLVKVTSNLTIKCPHCGRKIPVRLRPRPRKRPAAPPKSESKPMPPVI